MNENETEQVSEEEMESESIIVWPTCPICLKRYGGEQNIPVTLQPCGHGMCQKCFVTYRTIHNGTECSVCRRQIIGHSINYDLKNACSHGALGDLNIWKDKLVSFASLILPVGEQIHIDDEMEEWVPLIVYKLTESDNIKTLRSIICELFAHNTAPIIMKWVSILNFTTKTEAQIYKIILWLEESRDYLGHHQYWLLKLICNT